jgi:hypothetical protein
LELTNKKEYYKYLLKEFYIEKISKSVWEKCKNFSIDDNLIITTGMNFNKVKQIISSLILQSGKILDFESSSLYDLILKRFKKEGDVDGLNSIIENKGHLILYEVGDENNKLYPSILSYIFSNRIIHNRHNILVLTTRKPTDILSEDLIKQFKIVDFKETKPVSQSLISSENIF